MENNTDTNKEYNINNQEPIFVALKELLKLISENPRIKEILEERKYVIIEDEERRKLDEELYEIILEIKESVITRYGIEDIKTFDENVAKLREDHLLKQKEINKDNAIER